MERRHQILRAAGQLLCERGPGKTTMADIARAAGVAVGSVYLEFRGKAEILGALSAVQYDQVLVAMREAAAAAPPEARLRATLRARLHAFLALVGQGSHAPQLMACYCEAVEGPWRRFQAEQRQIVAAAIADGIAAGALAPESAQAVDAVLRACATLTPPMLRVSEGLVAEAEALFDLLFDGLRARMGGHQV